jgi:YVTN family beta-propeller protein
MTTAAGRRLALVVTVDRYDDPGLRELAAPAADAEHLAEVLGRPDLGGFEVDFLHNPTSWATYERVEGLLADRRPADLVLLHFSCHGLKDVGGELYLAATNTVPGRLASTAVDSAWITRMTQRSRAQRVVLLLDCCYGGAFERGLLARAAGGIDVGDQFRPAQLGESRGRVVITASTAMEYAFEGGRLSDGAAAPSVFTGALVEGIRSGAADRDQDGYVALDELYDYVYDRVRDASPQQTPCKWEFGIRGELYVARNPFRRVVEAPLPKDLLDLLDHPTPGARLAAVQELGDLAAGPHLARAAAARAALGRMVDDDSRRVAAAAEEALRRTRVRLGTYAVELRGPPRRVADVPIEGPPLALASTVSTSDSGLRARVEVGRLHVAWTGPGEPDGTVRLSGPAGEAVLHVTGEPDPGVPPVAPPRRPLLPRPRLPRPRPLRPLLSPVRAVLGRHRTAARATSTALSVGALLGVLVLAEGTPPFRTVPPSSTAPASPGPGGSGGAGPADAGPPVSAARPVVVAAIRVGKEPEGVAVSPDNRTVYVANQGERMLSVVDPGAKQVRGRVTLQHTPRFVAVSRDGARVYVSTYEEDGSGSTVAEIDANALRVVRTVPAGPEPFALAVGPDDRIWVPSHARQRVQIIDSRTLEVSAEVGVPKNPHAVALSADGNRAYTPDHESNMVSVIDARADTPIRHLRVGRSPHSLAVTPDGRTVVVANYDADTVNAVDTATGQVGAPVKVGDEPQSVAVATDGRHAYVVNEESQTVSTFAIAAGRVTATVPVGKSPRAVAVAPDGRHAYVTNGEANTVSVLRLTG